MVGLYYAPDPLESLSLREQGTDAVPAGTGQVHAAELGEGSAANYFPRILRSIGRTAAETGVYGADEYGRPIQGEPEPAIDPDVVNAEFGIPGHLKFDKPTPRSVAKDLHDHKLESLQRQEIISRREGGVLTGGAARFVTNIVAGTLDPINLAVGFIPVAGEARIAAMLEQAGSAVARAGIRAGIGGAQGAVGMLALQPLEFGLSRQEHEDYTMGDALRSIALGTVMGGGMHAGIGAGLDRYTGRYRNPVARGLDGVDPNVREGLLQGSLGQVIDGRPVDVRPALDLVPETRGTARFIEDPLVLHERGELSSARAAEIGDALTGASPEEVARLRASGIPVDPEMWKVVADNLAKAEASREGGLAVVTDQLGYLPKTGEVATASEREAAAVIKRAMALEAERGGEPAALLDQAIRDAKLPAAVAEQAQRLLAPSIAEDVVRQLTAAGMPAEQARAYGALVQSRYEARADRLGAGTAEQLYRRDFPDIVQGSGRPDSGLRMTVNRTDLPPDPGVKEHVFIGWSDAEGKPLATAYLQFRDDLPGVGLIESVSSVGGGGVVRHGHMVIGGEPGALGPRTVREMARQIFDQYPDIDRLEGLRMSGARGQPEIVSVTREQVGATLEPGELGQRAAQQDTRIAPTGPLGSVPDERDLTALDILAPETPAQKPLSRAVETIAADLMERGKQALRNLGVRSGIIHGPAPNTDEIISRAIADEVRGALQRSGHAGDWYTAKVQEAMRIASIIHPELATDPNARTAFTAALAITSQGETVPSNVRLADQAYEYFKQHGRFPTDLKVKAPSINDNLGKFNKYLDKFGADEFRQFLHTEYTVRELEAVLGKGEEIGGENKATRVYGSAIFGPKIGQGFFQNLNGNFTPVTMDLWFMRGWGRLTGTLVGMSPEVLAKQRLRLTTALEAAGEKVPRGAARLEARAEAIVKEHEQNFRLYRDEYNDGTRAKAETVYAAERYLKGLHGINETPSSGAHRDWIRTRVNRARELLAAEGTDLTNADLQAAWWYPEKDLYGKLGGRDSETINVDYATAWRDVARARGISDDALGSAVGAVEHGPGPATAAEIGGGVGAGGGAGVSPVPEVPAAGSELEQAGRGKIRLATEEARALVTLFRDADASTFGHEISHHWLTELFDDAAHPEAPAGLVNDARGIREWLGITEGEAVPRDAQEKFATGFEQYLREGQAPIPGLASIFEQFKDWLTRIYQTITGLGEPISPEVRGFFDRLLTPEERAPGEAPPTVSAPPSEAPTVAARAPAAGEPGGPRPSDTLAEINAHADELERLQYPPRPGEPPRPESQAAADLVAEAESHASAVERAAYCITR